jgi:hypothetical protein
MRQIGIEDNSIRGPQRTYAKLAGFLFLWLIVTGLAGDITISHIVGSGTFAESARRVASSSRLYRVALLSELIETLSAALLAFALYVTLKAVNEQLAQFAMYWRLGEAFIGSTGVIFGFMKLHLYTQSLPFDQGQLLLNLLRQASTAAYNIGVLCFSIGSSIFFYLFLKSRYIPKTLSIFGVFASLIVTIMCLGSLVFPEHAAKLQYGWTPMAIAEVTTGFWLLFAAKIPS